MSRAPLKIGIVHFTGCSGCQLMLLNCESQFALLADHVDCLDASMVTSARNATANFDLLLVEGAISSPGEAQHLRQFRSRCRVLVALGACALTGGINRFAEPSRREACARVYGPLVEPSETFPPRPVSSYVTIDYAIPGCPPERAFRRHRIASAPAHPGPRSGPRWS